MKVADVGARIALATGLAWAAVGSATARMQTPTAAPSTLVQPANWWSTLPRAGYAELEKVGTFQDWYEVYRLTPDTYAIYEPYQFQEAISYLLLGSAKAVLVDTGNGIGRSTITCLAGTTSRGWTRR